MKSTGNCLTTRNTDKGVPKIMAHACSLALVSLAMGYVSQAAADEFTLDNGDQGRWSLDMSLGNMWRTKDANPNLYSKPYGGLAGDGNQAGDLNYGKGDPVSTPFNISGEVQMKHDNLGFLFGARAWYDYTQKTRVVPIGSAITEYTPNQKLSDQGMYPLSKFSGATLTNAYVFGNFEPMEGKPLTVKLGDQVVNWGESLFIPGINQFGALNYGALVTPGATIKDALLPIPQIDANWGLGDGLSLEAFYQFTWVHSVAPGCGTFWSVSDTYNCGGSGALLGDSTGVGQYQQVHGLTPLNALTAGLGMPNYHPTFGVVPVSDIEPKKQGQFGASVHYFVPAIDTDFGLYGAAFNQRLPMLDIIKVGNPNQSSLFSGTFNGMTPGAVLATIGGLAQAAGNAAKGAAAAAAAGNAAQAAALAAGAAKAAGAANALGGIYPLITPLSVGWDYSAPLIKEVGLSAATEVGGWSLAGEASYTMGVPVQLNPGDMVVGDLMGNLPAALGPAGALIKANAGPLAGFASQPAGTVLKGYDLHDKSQFQMNTTKLLSQVAGADSLTLVGEIGFQHWTGIDNPTDPNARRYGRGFAFGYAAANPAVCAKLNPNPNYCAAQGFDTPNAWGYRMQGELSYPNAIAGWNLKPRMFWSQDVHGTSGDGIFLEHRHALGVAVRAEYLSKYYVQIVYTTFNHNATYDVLNDRDNIAAVAGIHF